MYYSNFSRNSRYVVYFSEEDRQKVKERTLGLLRTLDKKRGGYGDLSPEAREGRRNTAELIKNIYIDTKADRTHDNLMTAVGAPLMLGGGMVGSLSAPASFFYDMTNHMYGGAPFDPSASATRAAVAGTVGTASGGALGLGVGKAVANLGKGLSLLKNTYLNSDIKKGAMEALVQHAQDERHRRQQERIAARAARK